MKPSLFDELSTQLEKDPSMLKRGGPRVDLSLLLFNARDSIRDLWTAAQAELDRLQASENTSSQALNDAVNRLAPIFGPRKG